MNRRINTEAAGRILDSLNIRRQAALLSLPFASSSTAVSVGARAAAPLPRHVECSAAEEECNELTRAAIADAIELRRPPPRAVDASAATGSSGPPAPLQPRAEVGSVLEGRRLVGLPLDGLRFTASFNRSNLSGSTLRRAYVAHSTFNLACLTGSDLSGAQFHSCTFVGAEAREVLAANARFSHCQFRQCDLRRWDVRGATFFQCSFTLSDLEGWGFDGQTTIIEPADWSRCRRLGWRVLSSSGAVRECRVVGPGTQDALSLPPAGEMGEQQPRHRRRRKQGRRG